MNRVIRFTGRSERPSTLRGKAGRGRSEEDTGEMRIASLRPRMGGFRNSAGRSDGVYLVLALMAAACSTDGANQNAVSLGEPEATLDRDFAVIQTVRELPGGRVLVADPLGQSFSVVDLDAGTVDLVGREGEGPGEYRQPDSAWPLPEGRTLLVDLGNGRLSELGPDLSFGETRPYMLGTFQPGAPITLVLPQAVDGQGGLYFRELGMPSPGGLPDSAQVLRYDWDTEVVDTVATIKLADRTRTTSGGPNNQAVRIAPIPLSPADAYGVADNGRLVVARALPDSREFWVEWITRTGEVTRGPGYPYTPVRLGQAEKEAWREEQSETGGGISISVTAENGAMSMQASRGGASGDTELDSYTWPETLPAFQGGILVDGSGRAWLRRYRAAGELPTYDVFSSDGVRDMTVTLPSERRRIVSFGAGVAYVVRMDDFDLQYLERYALP